MNLERKRCWLTHYRREDWEYCPLCNAPIRWMYDGDLWIPCDREPVRFSRGIDGNLTIVAGGGTLDYCMLDDGGRLGLLPHVYSCDSLNGWHGVKIER